MPLTYDVVSITVHHDFGHRPIYTVTQHSCTTVAATPYFCHKIRFILKLIYLHSITFLFRFTIFDTFYRPHHLPRPQYSHLYKQIVTSLYPRNIPSFIPLGTPPIPIFLFYMTQPRLFFEPQLLRLSFYHFRALLS